MRLKVLIIGCFISLAAYSQVKKEAVLKKIDGYHFYSISDEKNKKLIIFLHGGVSNPHLDQAPDKIKLDYLFENNLEFLRQASLNSFNIIAPISNDSLNWLTNPQKTFSILKKMISQSTFKYEATYLSGFSDGGTGSFKIFYKNPDYFDGLIVFNGYPQHRNFYKKVNYNVVDNKKVLFWGTEKDKVIPYEFLIAEYCKQKKKNANTFLYLAPGGHSFNSYNEKDFQEVFNILTDKNRNEETEPIQGFIKNDQLIALYHFRKKIVRRYNFGKDIYEANVAQHKK